MAGGLLATASVLALVQALAVTTAAPAAAQTWVGGAAGDPNNCFNPANWSGGVPTTGEVTINTATNKTVIGVTSPGSGAASGSIHVGRNGTGDLTIQNGSTLTTTGLSRIAENAGASGAVTVNNGTWNIVGTGNTTPLIIGNSGTSGALTISNSGSVSQCSVTSRSSLDAPVPVPCS